MRFVTSLCFGITVMLMLKIATISGEPKLYLVKTNDSMSIIKTARTDEKEGGVIGNHNVKNKNELKRRNGEYYNYYSDENEEYYSYSDQDQYYYHVRGEEDKEPKSAEQSLELTSDPSAGCDGIIFRTLSNEGKKAILDRHNELRRKVAKGEEKSNNQPQAADMRKLVWSDELERIAQKWADGCVYKHSNNKHLGIGENLAIESSRGARAFDKKEQAEERALKLVTDWYIEVDMFKPRDIKPFRFTNDIGHYSQMVWADTEELGCGMIYVKENASLKTYLVCNYSKAGNYGDGTMYTVGPPCSKCPRGYSCDEGLCAKH